MTTVLDSNCGFLISAELEMKDWAKRYDRIDTGAGKICANYFVV